VVARPRWSRDFQEVSDPGAVGISKSSPDPGADATNERPPDPGGVGASKWAQNLDVVGTFEWVQNPGDYLGAYAACVLSD
jgi:hypothetical protein